ncbi:MAG: hypothetical protein ACI83D_000317 [Planctomycetota bacterium]|jgi:hypothetical protein
MTNNDKRDLINIMMGSVLYMLSARCHNDLFPKTLRKPYKGIEKWTMAEEYINTILKRFSFGSLKIQVEIAGVYSMGKVEYIPVHYHKDAFALCCKLGATEGFKYTSPAYVLLGDKWGCLEEKELVYIPPMLDHSFCVHPSSVGHRFYFLSIQTPGIFTAPEIDFHNMDPVPFPVGELSLIT